MTDLGNNTLHVDTPSDGQSPSSNLDYVVRALRDRGVDLRLPSPLQQFESRTITQDAGVTLLIKRDDLISPLFPGNKFRKLVPHLYNILTRGEARVVTFGGAFSNHLYAFSSSVKVFGFNGIACVRGERVEPLNPLLAYAESCGVELHFIDRDTYRKRKDSALLQDLRDRFGPFYLIPEGGTDVEAVASIAQVANEVTNPVDLVVAAVGTGGTLGGLALGFAGRSRVLGVSVLRGANRLDDDIRELLSPRDPDNWTIDHTHHCGGYARTTPELWQFLTAVETDTGISFDPVYTGKALLALRDYLRDKPSHSKQTIMFVHTGGVPIDTRSSLTQQGR